MAKSPRRPKHHRRRHKNPAFPNLLPLPGIADSTTVLSAEGPAKIHTTGLSLTVELQSGITITVPFATLVKAVEAVENKNVKPPSDG